MKQYLNKLLIPIGLSLLLLGSCKKQETQVFYEGGTTSVLSANLKDTIPLVPSDSLSTAITFAYTNPNYIFSNGISSQNVTYSIQVDTVGSNFSNPALQTVTGDLGLSTSMTVKDLNKLIAGKLGLAFGQNHKIQVRLITSLGTNQAQLISNSLSFDVTPYAPPPLITPPTTGTLFIVGSATPGGSASGWNNPIDASNLSIQQFTQVSPTEYKITIPLIGAGEYKLIAKSGSWGEQWSVATQDDPTEIYGGSFISNGNNNLAPPTSGTYDIDVNFQTGKFTVALH